MVKYSSRVGGSVTKKVSATARNAKRILSAPASTSLTAGTNLNPDAESEAKVGGVLPTPPAGTFVAQVEPKQSVAGSIPVGGSASVGGAITAERIDNMTYPEMIMTLQHMDNSAFGHLQGIAAAYLNMQHPLAKPYKIALGGSFEHPRNIAKIATRDVMKAPNALRLAMALHEEWLDDMNGKPTGGGLFMSLKMLAKKGIAGAKKALSAVAEGGKAAVRALASGTKAGVMVAKSVSNAIDQGLKVASVLEPAISQAFPKAGDVVRTAQALGETAQATLQRGIATGEKVSAGLDPLVAALGPVDAPLVELGPEPEFVS